MTPIKSWSPEWEPDTKPEDFPAAARILGGATSRFLRNGFSSPIFNKRVGLFESQRVTELDDGHYNIQCLFYERLRSLDEIYRALVIRNKDPWQVDYRATAIELSIDIFPSFYDAVDGVVPMPGDGEPSRGGHNIAVYDVEEDHFLFQHVWSNGLALDSGTLPIDYLDLHLREAWMLRFRTGQLPDEADESGVSARADGEVRTDLFTPWIQINQRAMCTTFFQWKEGAGSGQPWLQVVAIAKSPSGKPVIAGWAHGRKDDDLIEFEELFVWPRYRGKKIGTVMAADALMMARAYGALEGSWVETTDDAHSNELFQSFPEEWMRPTIPHWLRNASWIPCTEKPVNAISEPADMFEMMMSFGTPEQRAIQAARLREIHDDNSESNHNFEDS